VWDRLSYWLQSGRQRPLTDLLDDFEIHRLSEALAALVFLGTILGWSIWSMRPLRLILRVRLRTLMALVAIVSVECAGGAAVWNRWARWDRKERNAYIRECGSIYGEIFIEAGAVLRVDVLETLPGHPITGEYRIQSDGRIDLGFYGKIYIAGSSVSEAKEKIVLHLRRYLDDRQLGLIEFSASEPNVAPSWTTSPSESDFVFVDLVIPSDWNS
jgi:hypothetical protein